MRGQSREGSAALCVGTRVGTINVPRDDWGAIGALALSGFLEALAPRACSPAKLTNWLCYERER